MDDTFQLIKSLLRSPIAFHRVFADIAGGACNGLFLSQLWYWSQRTDDPDGWIYKTQEEWTDETALSRREQETARKSLIAQRLLQEDRRGLPARLYYRLSIDTLQTRLSESAKQACPKAPNKKRQNVQSFYTENTAENTPEITMGRERAKKTPASHCFPSDWILSEDLKAWAREKYPAVDLDYETEQMRDHEFRDPHTDWDKVWRTWIRRAATEFKKANAKIPLPPLVIADDGIPF